MCLNFIHWEDSIFIFQNFFLKLYKRKNQPSKYKRYQMFEWDQTQGKNFFYCAYSLQQSKMSM